jgi:uncharacterized protein
VRVKEIYFEGLGARLSGTVTLPDGPDCPGLLLIGGSGPSDRHNGGFFDALGEHLLGSGVATLAYDKRGVGKSTGEWPTATVDELAADAGAALAALRSEPIVSGPLTVLGHSEGGWVALRLLARQRTGARLIMNSCPSVSFLEAELFALDAAGASPVEARRAGELLRDLARAARDGNDHHEGQEIVAPARHERWYVTAQESGFTLDRASWAQLRVWGGYDPLDDLKLLDAPTLVTLGAKDPLVPLDASAACYKETARSAGRSQEITIFPDADHRLQRPDSGDFAAGYLPALSEWAKKPVR